MVEGMQTYETPSAFLASLGGSRRRILALGEPTHSVEEFLLLRNDFFKDLVDWEGYTAIAIESDCLAGLIVDDYISGGQGSLDEVMETGFSHDFGRMKANRELVQRLRSSEKPLRFFGVDPPIEMSGASSPRASLVALHAFLGDAPHSLETIEELLGEDGRWSNPEAAMDPSKSVGASQDAIRLRLIADDLQNMLLSQLPRLAEEADPETLWRARLHARTATGLLRYHAAIAGTAPDRWTRLIRVRSTMMAENLLAIAENHRTLVFAHNSHLQRLQSHMTMGGQDLTWWSAGAIAATALGDEYAFIASALGSAPEYGVAGQDTLEGFLSTLAAPGSIVSSAQLAEALPFEPKLRTHDYRYFPLDADRLRDSDGITYVNAAAS